MNDRPIITIGLASTSTRVENYLGKTISSIIAGIPRQFQDEVRVLLFDCDTQNEEAMAVQEVRIAHSDACTSGLLTIHKLYDANVNERAEPQTRSKDAQYVSWRKKQTLDYSRIFDHCASLSTYYLHLEDDVLCAPEYYRSIRRAIQNRQNDWSIQRFCDLGFIGVLLHSQELPTLASMCRLFSDQIPVDWILDSYVDIKRKAGCSPILHGESLFQHIGYHRSLRGEVQQLQSSHFDIRLPQRVLGGVRATLARCKEALAGARQ